MACRGAAPGCAITFSFTFSLLIFAATSRDVLGVGPSDEDDLPEEGFWVEFNDVEDLEEEPACRGVEPVRVLC